jgi:peptidyl-tRNA hydrolase
LNTNHIRFRFGISDEFKKEKIDYVLGDWDDAEKQHFRTIRIGI